MAPEVSEDDPQQPGQRKRRRPGHLVAIAVSCLLLLFGYVVRERMGRTTLVVEWPLDERAGARLDVDGQIQRLPPEDPLLIGGPSGRRSLQITRSGYETISEAWTFARGETRTFRPEWKPTPETTRAQEYGGLQYGLTILESQTASEAANYANPHVAGLQARIGEFRRRWPGTPECLQAASLCSRLPSAADILSRSRVPPDALQAAGNGDAANAPAELVAVFAEAEQRQENALRATPERPMSFLAVHPDGKTLLVAGADHLLRIWDVPGVRLIRTIELGKGPASLALSPDGQSLALAESSDDGKFSLKLLNATTGEVEQTSEDVADHAALAFSPNGSLLAVGEGESVAIWDVGTWKKTQVLKGHSSAVRCVTFSPDGQTVASIDSGERAARLWNVATGAAHSPVGSTESREGASHESDRIAFSSDGKSLVLALGDSPLQFWDIATGQEKTVLSGDREIAQSFAFSDDGQLLATADNRGAGAITIWDARTGTLQQEIIFPGPPHDAKPIRSLAILPDGRHVAVVNSDAAVYLLRLDKRTADDSSKSVR